MTIRHILLCRPTYFRVDYAINPWMQIGSVDLNLAQRQWETLVQAYQATGVQVAIIEQQPDVPDMVFAADQAIWLEPKTFLLSSFRYQERQKETQYYKEWFLKQGYTLKLIEEPGIYFEGNGDCLLWKKGVYFMGVGYRNSQASDQMLQAVTGQQFLPLKLVSEKFYHLDTCLCVVNETTALYYPPAFDAEGIALLQASFPTLIEVATVEAENFALNSVVCGNSVLIQKGNALTNNHLIKLGLQRVELDLGEFVKSGGGIHCLGQVLEY